MILVVILLAVAWVMQRNSARQQQMAKVGALDVLLTRISRWHRLQERLLEGPMPARYELKEAQEDLTSAILGLKVILE